METVARPPADAELHLLTDWGESGATSRHRVAAISTLLLHAFAITVLMLLPTAAYSPPALPPEPVRRVTPLIEPPTILTQKAPNKGKISKEFDAREEVARPRLVAPAGPPPTQARPTPPRPAVIPSAPAPKPSPAVPLPEPPKIETATNPKLEVPQIAQTPQLPPQIQPVEKPKLPLENLGGANPGPPTPRIPIPSTSVRDAVRDSVRGSSDSSTLTIGDPGASGSGYGGPTQAPTNAVQGSNVQLLSDPGGVDFAPYLRQILQTIRRNWQAVMPESVKLGRRGKVVIQFSIKKNGEVGRLVYESQSGAEALDRAAVAGISASNPFPPLPGEFKSDRIVLRLNFAYNMPR